MSETNTTVPEFHLGFTMAGAASAGCYTAGAMDYLFEILDLWEKAKDRRLPAEWGDAIYSFVPQHKVIIDAMGGTSAGGMTTVMAAIYALKGKINPVADPAEKNKKKNNIFYDSWVLMADEQDKPLLFEKTLATKDLDDTQKIQSLLNSDFIDTICDNAFQDDGQPGNLPPYFSDKLEMILSHTMLRSIPLAVDFTTPIGRLHRDNPEHNTFDHFITSHFKLKYDPAKDINKYLPLDPFGPGAATMKLATKATGAFPVGLRFREFFKEELSTAYLQKDAERIVFSRATETSPTDKTTINWPADFPNPFPFVSIDGGAVNNEPYGEVLGVLKERYGIKKPDEHYKYALIMIDPFPDLVPKEEYKQPEDLFTIMPAIIGALWDQSKLKRAEMLDAYSNDYYRGEIYPSRWKKILDAEGKQKYIREDHPIACGASMAFSGFFDIDFRQHDFFLGRNNARNFFRTYFTLEYDPAKGIVHPIHKSWTKEMVDHFKMPGKDGSCFLPIIPDMFFLASKMKGVTPDPYNRTVGVWPQYDPAKLFAMKDKMKARVERMLELTYKKIKPPASATKKDKAGKTEPAKDVETKKWIMKNYHSSLFGRITAWIGGGVLRLVFKFTKGKIANRVTQAAFEWILKGLEAKGLLKKYEE